VRPASIASSKPQKDYGSYAVRSSWSDVNSGAATLRRGDGGPAVEQLQRRLNAAGARPPLDVDGKLGPKTEAALKRFQGNNGVSPSGVFGSDSFTALNNAPTCTTPPTQARTTVGSTEASRAPTQADLGTKPSGTQRAGDLANAANARAARSAPAAAGAPEPGRADGPFASSRSAREAQAEQLLRANGQWPPQPGRAYAIQIDQDAPPASASRRDRVGHLRAYTGQTSVFKFDNGRLNEVGGPFRSASHPGQTNTRGFTDVNGDGQSDIAHLRSGVYQYRTRPNGSGRLNPTNRGQMQVARDINHDGTIDARENQQRYTAGGLQWHEGKENRPSSVGCQTMAPGDFARFRDAVQGDSQFTYLLVRRPNDVHGANPL
jgi:peptidoglycan hydrolase-like protein with peptidoglycan-binding domain